MLVLVLMLVMVLPMLNSESRSISGECEFISCTMLGCLAFGNMIIFLSNDGAPPLSGEPGLGVPSDLFENHYSFFFVPCLATGRQKERGKKKRAYRPVSAKIVSCSVIPDKQKLV